MARSRKAKALLLLSWSYFRGIFELRSTESAPRQFAEAE